MNAAAIREALPYTPRDLTRAQLQRQDVYLYESPKLGRRVTVVRPSGLALALEFEFAAEIDAFVERPRLLRVDGAGQELSFWTRTHRGLEQFHLLTAYPDGHTGPARAAARKRDAIVATAAEAQVALRLVPETQFLRRAVENANRIRLLPYVQTARDLSKADELREHVLALFEIQTRHSFYHIERVLSSYDARDVRAITCSLIHGGQLRINWTVKLHMHTMVEMGGNS
ncbi:hypothetical protein [Pseudoxanthomonas sp.]|uniref:hypothetical protein n=1 Tax=Pseudoxanthomonas sp. TaxID=1871049 RepID=UPI00259075E1|nr:hypothetical protein [Pseudoxanthomonas sp.]MCR6686998.1 hypothetical protein [Pseudoxanthomonas sp.]